MTVLFTIEEILPEEFRYLLHRPETCRIVYPSCKGSRKETRYFTSLVGASNKIEFAQQEKNGELII